MHPQRCFVSLLLGLLGLAANLNAQNFLLNAPPSPQANGTAGLYTSSATDDPLAPISNPALLGLMAERNRVMVGFFPERMSWDVFTGIQFKHSARAVYLGFDRATLEKYFKTPTDISLGIGYQEVYYDQGEIQRTNEQGQSIGIFHPFERSRGFTLSAAVHKRYWQGSIGLSQRFSRLDNSLPYPGLSANLYSTDLGFYVQAPLEQRFYKQEPAPEDRFPKLRVFCTPALSYALMNVGPKYDPLHNGSLERLPREAKLGWNLSAGLHASHPATGRDWRVLSVACGVEAEDLLLSWSGHDYQTIFGDLRPVANLFGGRRNSGILLRKGLEIGVAEAVYWRTGSSKGTGGQGWGDVTTDGYGVCLAGLLKVITLTPSSKPSPVMDFLMQHLDVQFDQSTLHGDHTTLDGVTYSELALIYKY